jgi:hypothetical protein
MRRGLAAVALSLALAACTSAAAPASPSPSAVASVVPAHASKTSGGYRLDLDLPKAVWQASELITGSAALATTGTQPIALYGASSGLLVFTYAEVGGNRTVGGLMTADCGGPQMLDPARPITAQLGHSGGYQPDNPDDAWRQAFIEHGLLPAGRWEVRVEANFAEFQACGGGGSKVQTSIQIEVK